MSFLCIGMTYTNLRLTLVFEFRLGFHEFVLFFSFHIHTTPMHSIKAYLQLKIFSEHKVTFPLSIHDFVFVTIQDKGVLGGSVTCLVSTLPDAKATNFPFLLFIGSASPTLKSQPQVLMLPSWRVILCSVFLADLHFFIVFFWRQ